MFDVGQKVVCINDDFTPVIKHLYRALPVKGKTYTVRECELGRGRVTSGQGGANETHYRVLLVELVNPPDPYVTGETIEMGFRSDRFAEPEQLENSEELEEFMPAPHERELVTVR